ncbi:hypothetical protein Ple7327_2722 [Pleurocapsa sp. PCC 7327]|uniref:hypothetical protein n=1 Tax=Pleurocapsa sp. PCC 7327 TaxID=118163 RepID=UPI00029FA1D8|nr:hypothetical protein [Pleurocapsa sp. PCC 7327]AFY77999.1 hypothetical protein Ple7327_2722 [Pleurocapsa sp. PCC 7327]
MEEQLSLEACPKCGSPLRPPLKTTGRQICVKCGWTNIKRESKSSVKSDVSSTSKIESLISSWKQKISFVNELLKLNKNVKYGLASVIGIAVIGWGSTSLYFKHQADSCRTETKEAIGKISEEWDDVMSRAKASNRLNMQANISDLQHIKRKVSDAKWPQCALVAKSAVWVGMQSDINQLLKFAGGDDISYDKSFAWKIFADEIKQITSSGETNHSVNSEDDAKKAVEALFIEEINKINAQMEPLKQPFSEYESKSNQLSMSLYDQQRNLREQYKDVVSKYTDLQLEKTKLEMDKLLL